MSKTLFVLFGHIFPFVTRDGKMTPQQTVATKLTEKSKSFGGMFLTIMNCGARILGHG